MSLSTPHLPAKDDIISYVKEASFSVGKGQIARFFNLKGDDRILLKNLLQEMQDEGSLIRKKGGSYHASEDTPAVSLVIIESLLPDGEALGRVVDAPLEARQQPVIRMVLNLNHHKVKAGDHVLSHLKCIERNADGQDIFEASVVRKMLMNTQFVVGVYGISRGRGHIVSINRKQKYAFQVRDSKGPSPQVGALVKARILPGKRNKVQYVEVLEQIASKDDANFMSLMAVHNHGIPHQFTEDTIKNAETVQKLKFSEFHQDISYIPFVTIDGEDARDYDDAVFVQADTNPDNPGGWLVWVAIADVSFYVRHGSPLDLEAYKRGNSTYFPEFVVPMLPELLSNNLCSLVPLEERPCLFVCVVIDYDGQKLSHTFGRGVIRSRARLTYTQVQDAIEGRGAIDPALQEIIESLYGAYNALLKNRNTRNALAIDRVERQIVLDQFNNLQQIGVRQRHDSHRLIEEMMVLANVAAAEQLMESQEPCMYRVHGHPSQDKLNSLYESLKRLNITLPEESSSLPKMFNGLLQSAKGTPYKEIVNDLVMMAQVQAYYSPHNDGHFGLDLENYAHFTSPIRRYSDVLVHRALVTSLSLGPGGLEEVSTQDFEHIGMNISSFERRSMYAERETVDRFIASFLSGHEGEVFKGRIMGVTSFGIFVQLHETGAQGLLPIKYFPNDFYLYHQDTNMIYGADRGLCFNIADEVSVRLTTADIVTGSLAFDYVDGGYLLSKKELKNLKAQRKPSNFEYKIKHSKKRGRR